MSHLLELIEEASRDQDGKIDFNEWEIMGKSISTKLLNTEYLPRATSKANQEKNPYGRNSPR